MWTYRRALALTPLIVGGLGGIAPRTAAASPPFVVVLGVAQDAGVPQAGTRRSAAWLPERRKRVASLGLVEPSSGRRWLFDATPDLPAQLWALDSIAPTRRPPPALSGVFITHAHIGHYTGLMYFGREAIGARHVPVFAMPRMTAFLRNNGPWSQLVELDNISLRPLRDERTIILGPELSVMPFIVPHRDEFSETVGFTIRGGRRAIAFVPDIDKWSAWGERRVEALVESVDVAYLDGTFHADGEIPGRAMAEIPHPFIVETIERFARLPLATRRKIRFIHLNRSNPALSKSSGARADIRRAGMRVAQRGERVSL